MAGLGFRTLAVTATGIAMLGGSALWAAMTPSVERGVYEIRARGASAPLRRQCVASVDQLVQIRHPGAACKRFTISSDARTINVSYECSPGNTGQTLIRMETPRLAQIDAQGLAGNMPFNDHYEARKVGECGS